MGDLDAGGRELTGEIGVIHSRITRLEQVSHELTMHKNVDDELDKAWREWETTFDATKDSIILTDNEFRIIQANLAVSRLFDRPLDQIVGKTCWQLVHGTDRPPKDCPLEKAKATKKHVEIELHLPQNGIWVADSVDPVFDQQGSLTGAVHIIRDITERKQVERLLRKERDRAQQYLDVAGVMFVAIDAEQRVGLINKKGCEILGYKEEEVIAKNWFDNFLPEKIREQARASFEKVVSGELDSLEYYENPILTKNGDQRLIAWHNTILRDDKGQVIAVLSSGEDITERKRSEETLRESEEKYRDLFENAREAILTLDLKGNITNVNKLIEEYGVKREEVIGKSHFDFIAKKYRDNSFKEFERLTRGIPVEGEVEIITPKGNVVVEYRNNPIRRGGQIVGIQEVLIDITERKRAEKMAEENQAQLKSLASQLTLAEEHERRRLATDLHDRISQALVISKIKLEALRKSGRSRKLDKALEEVCNSIGQTIQDTRTLTFDLGNPVLYELGFETAVSEWLTDQIQKKHGIAVEFEDDGDPKPLDDDVRVLLFRDVRELLINVVKHAGAHKVKVSLRKLDNHICVTVEDDGVGFDPVEVISMAAKRGEFGFFSIRERLEDLGGHLRIDSAPGCGCKVTMTAPLKQKEMTR
jgi:PAS domain S-box-containing protein